MRNIEDRAFKVLFIVPDFNYVEEYMSDYSGSFSLGVGYLSAVLKQEGFQTALLHLTKPVSAKVFVRQVHEKKPDLIAFSFFTHQRPDVAKYARFIRDAGITAPIVLGGVHPTTDPEDAMAIPGADYICVGEGEYPMLELCRNLQEKKGTTNISNIWARKDGKIIKNEVRPLLQDLDQLPFPDRDLFDYPSLADSKMGVFHVIATRGCPYQCTYCCNHLYQKIYAGKGKYVRFRKPESIIKEIKEGFQKYPFLKFVNLQDDAFCLDPNFVKDFCTKFKQEIGRAFHANTRINLLKEDVVKALSEGGCVHFAVGIESGNQDLREKILKRHMKNQEIIDGVRLAHRYGISVGTYNIIGLPTETIRNVLETVKLNVAAGADSMHVAIFQPYPNTELYDYCVENKILSRNAGVSTFFGESLLDQESMSKQEVWFAYKYFYIYAKLYKRFGKIKVFERLLDSLFIAKKTHRLQMLICPIMLFITHPTLLTYRIMLRVSPHLTRKIRGAIQKK